MPAGQWCDGHAGIQARECVDRLRALQRQQCAFRLGDDLAARADAGLQVGDVGVLAAGVDHQEQVVLAAGDHQVVAQAAGVVGEEGVALLEQAQAGDVLRHQRFQRRRGVVAHQAHLAHVRDVEEGGGLAALAVLGDDARRVLHRHRVAGEGHHAGAEFEVQRVQRGLQQRGGGSVGHRAARFRRMEGNRVIDLERIGPSSIDGAALAVRFT